MPPFNLTHRVLRLVRNDSSGNCVPAVTSHHLQSTQLQLHSHQKSPLTPVHLSDIFPNGFPSESEDGFTHLVLSFMPKSHEHLSLGHSSLRGPFPYSPNVRRLHWFKHMSSPLSIHPTEGHLCLPEAHVLKVQGNVCKRFPIAH